MIELSNNLVQTVATGQPVLYNTIIEKSGCAEFYRPGSGQIKLVKPGRYLITFSGNIAAATTGAAISMAIAQDGEALASTTMTVTPTDANDYFNVSSQTYIDVPVCCNHVCCTDVSVENISTQSVLVSNPNITAVRVNG